MRSLRFVMLEHTQRGDRHVDLLIEPPTGVGGRGGRGGLWAARWPVPLPASVGRHRVMLTALPPHRPAYLRYQGPISGGRGRVRRLLRGRVGPRLWRPHRLVLELVPSRRRAIWRLELHRRGPCWWGGVELGPDGGVGPPGELRRPGCEHP